MRVYGMVPQLPPEGKMGWHVAVDRSFQSTATGSSIRQLQPLLHLGLLVFLSWSQSW